ncbi:DUF6204 family protein [Kitasatospora sp. NBC_01250]|uniref:DUF6204 family protein n=1 Tax=unclassified Kitasatospora TaxID=2633591 RepID=UPI002E131468|nr:MULTISPECIES: DUF6204 family protein [unclassified Kitasatospora]WSJ66472.1 DUF6204 family protein [Kitasatospora sp. NBC_01302]
MTERTFRVTVRGSFATLSAEQRAELAAQADRHSMLFATFTTEGNLSYELAPRDVFSFRYLETGEADEDIVAAGARAEAAAATWLEERGYGYKNLRSQAEDMSKAALSKRQRKAQARG